MRIGSAATVATGWQPARDVRMTRPWTTADVSAPAPELEAADDRSLVDAFVAGRREAFDVIVSRHQRNVYHLCLRFVRNHEDASDLAQDVFVRAFRGLGKFKGDATLSTWLYRVSVNVCLNRVSVKRPVTEPVDAVQRVDVRAADPYDLVAQAERSSAVRAAIDQLPPKQRATVLLRVYQDLSHEEIARVLGTTVGAVKANFFHALGNLRRLMQPS